MKILIIDIKNNKTERLIVKTVLNRAGYFRVVFNNDSTRDYDFHKYDYFVNHGKRVLNHA